MKSLLHFWGDLPKTILLCVSGWLSVMFLAYICRHFYRQGAFIVFGVNRAVFFAIDFQISRLFYVMWGVKEYLYNFGVFFSVIYSLYMGCLLGVFGSYVFWCKTLVELVFFYVIWLVLIWLKSSSKLMERGFIYL